MRGQRTLQQYRRIDLALFALMLAVFETILVHAALRLFPQEPYVVSVTPIITAIVLMRWGPWAGIHAVLGALVYCYATHATAQQYLIYGIGNLFALLSLVLFRVMGKERIRTDTLKTLLFGLCVTLLMQAGRGLVALVLGAGFGAAVLFITSDIVTLLFTLVLMWIVRRLDGVFEDQRHYLLRLQKEQEEEKGGVP